jgi:hypothetical protein
MVCELAVNTSDSRLGRRLLLLGDPSPSITAKHRCGDLVAESRWRSARPLTVVRSRTLRPPPKIQWK